MADITILDALIISLIGFAIVFAVLIILMCVVTLMGLAADKGHEIGRASCRERVYQWV